MYIFCSITDHNLNQTDEKKQGAKKKTLIDINSIEKQLDKTWVLALLSILNILFVVIKLKFLGPFVSMFFVILFIIFPFIVFKASETLLIFTFFAIVGCIFALKHTRKIKERIENKLFAETEDDKQFAIKFTIITIYFLYSYIYLMCVFFSIDIMLIFKLFNKLSIFENTFYLILMFLCSIILHKILLKL